MGRVKETAKAVTEAVANSPPVRAVKAVHRFYTRPGIKGKGALGAFYRQGMGELGQLVQAFPNGIQPVETANTIWGQNPTPREAHEAKHGVAPERAKAAEQQPATEPEKPKESQTAAQPPGKERFKDRPMAKAKGTAAKKQKQPEPG